MYLGLNVFSTHFKQMAKEITDGVRIRAAVEICRDKHFASTNSNHI